MGDAEGSDDGLELFGEEKTPSMVTKKTRGELFEEHYLRCKIETNEDTFVKQKGGSLSLEGVDLGNQIQHQHSTCCNKSTEWHPNKQTTRCKKEKKRFFVLSSPW